MWLKRIVIIVRCVTPVVYVIRNNKDTVRLYTSLYYTKCKLLHVLAVRGSHHQAVYLRNEKKKNYTAVAVHLKLKNLRPISRPYMM